MFTKLKMVLCQKVMCTISKMTSIAQPINKKQKAPSNVSLVHLRQNYSTDVALNRKWPVIHKTQMIWFFEPSEITRSTPKIEPFKNVFISGAFANLSVAQLARIGVQSHYE